MLSLPQSVHGHTLALDGSRGTACAAALCVSCTALGSSQALQLLKGGTCTQTWHHSRPLSTQECPTGRASAEWPDPATTQGQVLPG